MKAFRKLLLLGLLVLPSNVRAELPWQFDQHTRYIALGDSLAAGVRGSAHDTGLRLSTVSIEDPRQGAQRADAYGVSVADVYSVFLDKKGRLLIERRSAEPSFQVHPSNAGHRAIANAFEAFIR